MQHGEMQLPIKLMEILKYESLHNHLEKKFDVAMSIVKHKIKDKIKKWLIPLVSQKMGFLNIKQLNPYKQERVMGLNDTQGDLLRYSIQS
ncbi:hypothetical protein U3516DRAFT_769979 [Neocallimastix sp. 'constans']